MRALRVSVLTSFSASLAVTVWSMLATHNHVLHILHVILVSLTFLQIAVYLLKSAEIASLRNYRELCLRMTVDPDAAFIGSVRTGSPVFNACAGALAKYGIYVRQPDSMKTLEERRIIAAEGNSPSREGYEIARSTLTKIGFVFSDDPGDCPVSIFIGPFEYEHRETADFVLVCNKAAHLLTAAYISRVYLRHTKYDRILLIAACLCAAALLFFKQFPYAAAALAAGAAAEVYLVRHIERLTARLSFDSITRYFI